MYCCKTVAKDLTSAAATVPSGPMYASSGGMSSEIKPDGRVRAARTSVALMRGSGAVCELE